MENLFEKKGKLSVSIGEGYLSAYEVSVLKVGDVVETVNLAGEGYPVFLNGYFLFTAEVVIIGKVFALRVASLLPAGVEAQPPANPDEAIEMLPFTVRFAEIEVCLHELIGVGPGTFINLDTLYSDVENAELLVAGIPVARGKVGVTYENMTLRITEITADVDITADLEVRSSGSLLEARRLGEHCKDYDFRRPDKFSRNAIERMKDLHGLFMRNLHLKYRIFDNYNLIGDQLTFGELLRDFSVENYHYLLVQNRPWSSQIRTAQQAGKRSLQPSTYYLEPENARHPATEEQREFIRKIVTGDERSFRDGVFLLLSKSGPVDRLAREKEDIDFLLASLRGAWKTLVTMNFQLTKTTDSVDEIKIIHENDMILMIIVRDEEAQLDLMYIVYPYLTLEPYMGVLK